MDLVFDFSLAGGHWRRVTALQARAKSKKGSLTNKAAVDDVELDEILDKAKLDGKTDEHQSRPVRNNRRGFGGNLDDSE